MTYISQIVVNGLKNTFDQIKKWTRHKGLLAGNESNIIRDFHDSFKITDADADKVRMSNGTDYLFG